MTIKVKDCNDCPFLGFSECFGEGRNHCNATEDKKTIFRDDPDFPEFGELVYPEWCPLKKEEIKIVLSN